MVIIKLHYYVMFLFAFIFNSINKHYKHNISVEYKAVVRTKTDESIWHTNIS